MIKNESVLMKKTKKELLNIIDKQDDEIKELKEGANKESIQKISNLENKLTLTENKVKSLGASLEKANQNVYQHQHAIDKVTAEKDEVVDINYKLTNKLKGYKGLSIFLTIIVIVLLIIVFF